MDLDHLSSGVLTRLSLTLAAWWVEMVPGTFSLPGAEVQNLCNIHCFLTI